MKMKTINILLIIFTLSFGVTFSQAATKEVKTKTIQSYQEHLPTAHHQTALAVIEASKQWIEAFNKGDVKTCVEGYDSEAVMRAMPSGLKKGHQEISAFWTPFIQSGATNLVYTNVSVEVVDENTAFLSADWSMNVGRGVIYQEKWEKKAGRWVLTYDDFEVLEQFKSPKENNANPIASHIMLEEVIKASMRWIKGFNNQNIEIYNGYTENATMNGLPFASVTGKDKIKKFWSGLIKDGATNLTYHNPTFRVVAPNGVLLSSDWSMNIGEGKIFQEKWVKKDKQWLLDYDEFKVLKQY
ncbi:MAG: YybH family protein [Ostreibacterium sp.]